MQGRAILVQAILSALVASWALILTLGDLMFFRIALDEVDVAPLAALNDTAYYVTKFVSGFGHATIAFLLFCFIRAERRAVATSPNSETTNGPESAGGEQNSNVITTDSTRGETQLTGYLLAAPVAIVLSLGTVWSVRWLILELARRIILGSMPQ
jgi:hypothetical protein